MPCRAGITTNLVERKKDWENEYQSLSNWTEHGPFTSREKAQEWEDQQYLCDKHPGGNEPDNPYAMWYGYRFDHLGY